MLTAGKRNAITTALVRNRLLGLSVLAAAAGVASAMPAHADINYFYQGGSTNTWDNGSTAVWATPTASSTPLTTWTSSNTSDAFFSTNASIAVGTGVVANSLTFSQAGAVTFNGANVLTLNSIFNTLASQSMIFLDPIQSQGQLVIHGVNSTTNGKGVTLGANTNQLNGGLLLTGGSVYFNFGNTANRYEVDPTHAGGLPFNSPTGFGGSTIQSGPIILTTVSGTDIHGNPTSPTITVDGNHSTLSLANIHTNDYVLPNAIVLNPSNATDFYTAMGAGSVSDSGTVAAGPYPAFATFNFAGQISGNGNVIISNDFYGGGGKGFTVFSNSNNNYTGKTIINNNGQNYLTFQIGAQNAIPVTSDLVFGAKSVGQAIGDTSISGKQIGAVDLNGFDVTVKSLSSDIASNLYVLGITNTNNHAADPSLVSGPHTIDGSNKSTLTIDSQGAFNNTFFQGNITDGSDFLTQANATTGTYQGPYKGAASNYLLPSNGLKVAIKLAATNSGVLTLNALNGSTGATANIADFGYTGGTTVSGGSLYVNGMLSAPSGAASQVLVTTPIAGHVAVLGGTGTINPDIHVQNAAALAPDSLPRRSPRVRGLPSMPFRPPLISARSP